MGYIECKQKESLNIIQRKCSNLRNLRMDLLAKSYVYQEMSDSSNNLHILS